MQEARSEGVDAKAEGVEVGEVARDSDGDAAGECDGEEVKLDNLVVLTFGAGPATGMLASMLDLPFPMEAVAGTKS